LDIAGCVVTTDALNTQKNIAAQIVAQKGDYMLALKGNHGLLYEDVSEFFRWLSQKPGGLKALCDASEQTRDWGHGRFEERRCHCSLFGSHREGLATGQSAVAAIEEFGVH
jgi:hypothetical protein